MAKYQVTVYYQTSAVQTSSGIAVSQRGYNIEASSELDAMDEATARVEGFDGFLKIVTVSCLKISPPDDNSFFDMLLNLPDDTSMAYVKGLVYGELNKRDKAIQ